MTQRQKNLNKLNEFFERRYGKELDSLNGKINKAETDDNGNFRVPTFIVSDAGFTQIVGKPSAFKLNAPAVVRTDDAWVEPLMTVYRLVLPYSELEIGLERDPGYLTHFMDTIIKQAIDRWRIALGDENVTRFGDVYLEWRRPESGKAFLDVPDGFELRFYGLWASEKVVITEEISTQEYIENSEEKEGSSLAEMGV